MPCSSVEKRLAESMFGRNTPRPLYSTVSCSENCFLTSPTKLFVATASKNFSASPANSPLLFAGIIFLNFSITSRLLIRWPAANASVRKWSANELIASARSRSPRWEALSAASWWRSHSALWSGLGDAARRHQRGVGRREVRLVRLGEIEVAPVGGGLPLIGRHARPADVGLDQLGQLVELGLRRARHLVRVLEEIAHRDADAVAHRRLADHERQLVGLERALDRRVEDRRDLDRGAGLEADDRAHAAARRAATAAGGWDSRPRAAWPSSRTSTRCPGACRRA